MGAFGVARAPAERIFDDPATASELHAVFHRTLQAKQPLDAITRAATAALVVELEAVLGSAAAAATTATATATTTTTTTSELPYHGQCHV